MCLSSECPLFCLRPSFLTVPAHTRRTPSILSIRYGVATSATSLCLFSSRRVNLSWRTSCIKSSSAKDTFEAQGTRNSNSSKSRPHNLLRTSPLRWVLLLLTLVTFPRESLSQYYEDTILSGAQTRGGHNFGPPWAADLVIPHPDYLANRRHMTAPSPDFQWSSSALNRNNALILPRNNTINPHQAVDLQTLTNIINVARYIL
ncbi:serine proteinase stubble-like, partial [Tropilaelaps mercedesae]